MSSYLKFDLYVLRHADETSYICNGLIYEITIEIDSLMVQQCINNKYMQYNNETFDIDYIKFTNDSIDVICKPKISLVSDCSPDINMNDLPSDPGKAFVELLIASNYLGCKMKEKIID
jgi:hypothetical protein